MSNPDYPKISRHYSPWKLTARHSKMMLGRQEPFLLKWSLFGWHANFRVGGVYRYTQKNEESWPDAQRTVLTQTPVFVKSSGGRNPSFSSPKNVMYGKPLQKRRHEHRKTQTKSRSNVGQQIRSAPPIQVAPYWLWKKPSFHTHKTQIWTVSWVGQPFLISSSGSVKE